MQDLYVYGVWERGVRNQRGSRMNSKTMYISVLIAGLLYLGPNTQAQSFSPPWDDPMVGYMFVYDGRAGYEAGPSSSYWDGGGAGTDLTGFYPLEELVTRTSDYYTFTFLPETKIGRAHV